MKRKRSSKPASSATRRPAQRATQWRFTARWYDGFWLAMVFVVGAILRFYHLDAHSLWTDETDSLYLSAAILTKKFMGEPHYLFWLAVHPFLRIGFSVFWLRFLSALLGALSVPAAFALGRQWFGRAEARLFAAATALSPYLIFYSREARYYAAMVFFVLLSLIVLTAIARKPRWWLGAIFVLIQGVAFGVHPTTLVFFVAQVLFLCGLGLWTLLRVEKGSSERGVTAERLKHFWPLAAVFVAIGLPMLVWLLGYTGFNLSHLFALDPKRRAFGVGFNMGFFVRPFLEFAEFPRLGANPVARVIFVVSLMSGFVLAFLGRRRWAVLPAICWAVTMAALWVFPSNNVYRVKYVSYLYPMFLLLAVHAWSAAIGWGLRRARSRESEPLWWAAALAVMAVVHLSSFGAARRLLSEKPASFSASVRFIGSASDALGKPDHSLFTDMPAYYGHRAHWEMEGLPYRLLVYLRSIHFARQPAAAAGMARYYLARPGLKWTSFLDPQNAGAEEAFLIEYLSPGFEPIAQFGPTFYDLWNYTVPLSAWKHNSSKVIPPGPSRVALFATSPLAATYSINAGVRDAESGAWRRELFFATSADYRFSLVDSEKSSSAAARIVEGALYSLTDEGRAVRLDVSAEGEAVATVPAGFYRAQFVFASAAQAEPFDWAGHYLEVNEAAGPSRFYRPEYMSAIDPSDFAMRAVDSESVLVLMRFGSKVDYPVWIDDEGTYELRLRQVVPHDPRLMTEVRAWLDGRLLGWIAKAMLDERREPKQEFPSVRLDLDPGLHRFRFEFMRPTEFDVPGAGVECFFGGFDLERL